MNKPTLNGGESPFTWPETREALSFAGLCPACLEIPLAHYSGPAPVSQLPPFTVEEIELALTALDEEV